MKRVKALNFILILILCLSVLSILSSLMGPARIPLGQILSDRYADILRLRFFRIMLAIVAGAGLSLAGVILQGVLRNPLAEPYVLGVSSGSGLGAVIGLLFFSTGIAVNALAFIGGGLTIVLVCSLARVDKRLSPENMIISGILVNALFSSMLMFFISNSYSPRIHSIIWWLLGNLQVYNGLHVAIVAVVVLAGFLVTIIFSKELNALSLGEEEAIHLGVDVEKVKGILLLVSALVTSVVVSMCGIIGFVGLMMPHLARRLVGPDHRILVWASILMGAVFLLLCDVVSRIIMAPRELPIGVVTAFVGVPFFIYILRRSRKVYFK
ncbi:MAG: iron ABC transporter permease [Candidatus Omnitrophica bacterium]|nr:iron ABC transporter permease [Candidatus Omnitrophota bacterium]